MTPAIIIQARTGSTRLPGKVLHDIGGSTLLSYVIARCKMSQKAAGIILATTVLPADDPVAELGKIMNVHVYRGSEHDVLDRYICAAEKFGIDPIVRITADCPLIDPALIDHNIETYRQDPADYVHIAGYPNGLGAVEVLRCEALRKARKETSVEDTYYREHVMTYLTRNQQMFTVNIYQAPTKLHRPETRLSVDEKDDLEVVRQICMHFSPRIDFSTEEIIAFLDHNKKICAINAHVRQKSQ